MHHFFLPPNSFNTNAVVFPRDTAHQIIKVLRLPEGAQVFALDGSGSEFLTRLRFTGSQLVGEVMERRENKAEPGLRLTLAAKLSDDLMERIIATPAGEIIATWDGYVEAQGQVKDAAGVVFTDPLYANFSRRASCYGDVYVPQQSGPPQPSVYILVSVQTSYQGRETASLSRLISQ